MTYASGMKATATPTFSLGTFSGSEGKQSTHEQIRESEYKQKYGQKALKWTSDQVSWINITYKGKIKQTVRSTEYSKNENDKGTEKRNRKREREQERGMQGRRNVTEAGRDSDREGGMYTKGGIEGAKEEDKEKQYMKC